LAGSFGVIALTVEACAGGFRGALDQDGGLRAGNDIQFTGSSRILVADFC
jgi:hypothetical protein